ncbi:hypothetical protein CF642_39395, partial [Burkholderia pseudomallei]
MLSRDVPARLAHDARLVAPPDTRLAPIRIDAFVATLAPAQLDPLAPPWRDGAPAWCPSSACGALRHRPRLPARDRVLS